MAGDLAVPVPNAPVPKLPSVETKGQGPLQQKTTSASGRPISPLIPFTPLSPIKPSAPNLPPSSPSSPLSPSSAPLRSPILIVPPKTIPIKEVPKTPIKPLFKATPVWIKLGAIGFAVVLLAFSGLYGYWKFFVQSKLPLAVVNPSVSTTTSPTLPTAPTATTTAPIKFFNKLPNKSVTIDLPAKTSTALTQALKSEAKIEETRASVKQLKITYQGKLLTIEEFFSLMSIFTPKDFLPNYESEFAFAFFSQKEGARPILILKSKNKDLAKTQIADWEKTTMVNDVLPIFLNNEFKLPQYLPAFKSYLFINQPVRFLNINMPFASLNYAVYDNFVVFTASSAGMFVVLQDLTGQTVSQNYLDNLNASIDTFIK